MRYMQKDLLAIGKTGCYFLSIVHVANKYASLNDETTAVLKLFRDAVENKWCDESCFMLRPDLMMEALLGPGHKVTVRHESLNYVPKTDEVEITRFEKGDWAHFVCSWDGKVTYDPYGYVETGCTYANAKAKLGNAVSKRIFTIKKSLDIK